MSMHPRTSSSSHTPLQLASASQPPPHTPKASTWLPSQSQSPKGKNRTHIGTPHPCKCHIRPVPRQCRRRRKCHPCPNQVHSPPHTPISSSWCRRNRNRPQEWGASAFVNRTRAVADATIVQVPRSRPVVTHPVTVLIRSAVAATHTQGVELVAVAIAVACRDVGATARRQPSPPHAAFVQLVSVAIASPAGTGSHPHS